MKNIKRRILRLFFVMEIMVFAGFYILGPHGIRAQKQMIEQNEVLKSETLALETELHVLENSIAQWNAHPFLKEKIAREQLQMARKGDRIYYIS